MLKPNFNPLFYGKFIHGLNSKEKHSNSSFDTTITGGTGVEVKIGDETLNLPKENATESMKGKNQAIQDKIKGLQDSLKFKNPSIAKRLNALKTTSRQSRAAAIKAINVAPDAKTIKALKSSYGLRLRSIMEQVNQIEIADKNRGKLINALHKNVSSVRDEYQTAYKKGEINNDEVEKVHLNMLLDSYLLRVFYKNMAVMRKMPSSKVNVLALTVKDGKFIEGPIVDDVSAVRKGIDEAIKRWEDDDPRKVYKDSDWDFGHVSPIGGGRLKWGSNDLWSDWKKIGNKTLDGGAFSQIRQFTELRDLAEAVKNIDKFLPPLPDWGRGEKGVDIYTSTLAETKGKAYLARLSQSMKFLTVAGRIRIKLQDAGLGASQINLLSSKNAARMKLQKGGVAVGFVTVKQTGEVVYTDPTGKHQMDIKGKLGNIPKLMASIAEKRKDIEKRSKLPTVKEVKIGKKGILVVGDNLPKQSKAIKVDPSNAWVDISKGIKSGVRDVDVGSGSNIDKNMLAILKQAIKRTVEGMKGVTDPNAVMSKISDKQLKELKKETLDKHKPTIVAWGIASREGGFSSNKRIAKARAESAKRKLEKANPGVKVVAKWAIQGFGANGQGVKIDDPSKYKSDEGDMIKEWNRKFPKNKAKNARAIYAKLNRPSTWKGAEEKKFFKENFIDVRRATMQVEYPKTATNTQIAMNFEKSPNSMV